MNGPTSSPATILTFEGSFLAQMLLPSGQTVLQHAMTSKLLPALEGPKS